MYKQDTWGQIKKKNEKFDISKINQEGRHKTQVNKNSPFTGSLTNKKHPPPSINTREEY